MSAAGEPAPGRGRCEGGCSRDGVEVKRCSATGKYHCGLYRCRVAAGVDVVGSGVRKAARRAREGDEAELADGAAAATARTAAPTSAALLEVISVVGHRFIYNGIIAASESEVCGRFAGAADPVVCMVSALKLNALGRTAAVRSSYDDRRSWACLLLLMLSLPAAGSCSAAVGRRRFFESPPAADLRRRLWHINLLSYFHTKRSRACSKRRELQRV